MSYEEPQYTVLYTDGEVEYRQYESYLVSETVVEADSYRAAGNEGFRRLFRYITGNNQGRSEISMTVPVAQAPAEKIAMTVPVQQAEADKGWTISFMLPAEYTLETAPQPADPVRPALYREIVLAWPIHRPAPASWQLGRTARLL